MLKADQQDAGGALKLILSGTIDENDDLEKTIGAISGKNVVVNCKAVTRINSIGVKNWIKCFTNLAKNNSSLKFEELSTVLIEQVNTIRNFLADAEVTSVMVPYRCGNCQSSYLGAMSCQAIIGAEFEIPPVKCTKCGGEAEFDDLPEEFFLFLQG